MGKPIIKQILSAVGESGSATGHADIARSLKCLSMNYCAQLKYIEAEKHAKHALDKIIKAVGKYHIDIIPFAHNLIYVYEHMGKYHETESLHKSIIEVYDKAGDKSTVFMANAKADLSEWPYHDIDSTPSISSILFLYSGNGNSEPNKTPFRWFFSIKRVFKLLSAK